MGYQMPQMQPPQMENQYQPSNVVLTKVPSIDVVRNWQVSPGMSVSFIHASRPFMFIKTAPSSPFEQASIEIFKISKVDSMDDEFKESSNEPYVTRQEYDELKNEIRKLEERIRANEPVYRKPKKHWSDTNKSRSSSAKSEHGQQSG